MSIFASEDGSKSWSRAPSPDCAPTRCCVIQVPLAERVEMLLKSYNLGIGEL